MNIALALINGLFIGGVYGVISMGLAMIFGVLRIVNFAHGDFVMLGMLVTYLFFTAFNISPYYAIPAAVAAVGLVGYFVYRFLFKRLIGKEENPQLVISIALSLLIQNILLFFMGPDKLAITGKGFSTSYIQIGSIFFNQAQAVAFVFSVLISIGMHWFLTRSSLGKAIRASVDDLEVARMIGIPSGRIYLLTFLIGISLAAVSGVILETYYPFSPTAGNQFIALAFVIVVLGGLGDTMGAFFGGLIIGIVQQLSTVFLSIDLQNLIVFALFIILLIFRPQGLFGRGRIA